MRIFSSPLLFSLHYKIQLTYLLPALGWAKETLLSYVSSLNCIQLHLLFRVTFNCFQLNVDIPDLLSTVARPQFLRSRF